jgi:hypothetical protein
VVLRFVLPGCGRLKFVESRAPVPSRPLGGAAVRWPLVALAGLVALVLIGSWLPGWASGQGATAVDASRCPARVSDVVFPARPGRDRLLLPAGYQRLAPVTAVRCRFDAGGVLVASTQLDAARTSRLAALLVAPPGGWPDDALAAKRIVPLTDTQIEELSAPACAAPSVADLVVFAYGEGPDSAVLVREEPCADAANGRLTLRVPAGVAGALTDLGNG